MPWSVPSGVVSGAASGAPAGPIGAAVGAGVGGLVSLLQTFTNNKQAGEQSDADRQAQLRQFLAALTSQDANLANDQLNEGLTRDQAYMNTFSQNPVGQQQDIFRAAAMAKLGNVGAPHVGPGGVSNTADFAPQAQQFLSNDALAGAAGRFYGAAGALSPSAPVADLASMGFNAGSPATQQAQLGASDAVERARREREALRQRQRDALYSSLLTAGDTTSKPGDMVASTINRLGLMPPSLQANMARSTVGGSGNGTDYFNRNNPAA